MNQDAKETAARGFAADPAVLELVREALAATAGDLLAAWELVVRRLEQGRHEDAEAHRAFCCALWTAGLGDWLVAHGYREAVKYGMLRVIRTSPVDRVSPSTPAGRSATPGFRR